MTCTCSIHSAFRWKDNPRPSIFCGDGAFAARADGKTASQSASESVDRITRETGRNPGSVFGISAHADRLTEAGIIERKKRAAGHYAGKA